MRSRLQDLSGWKLAHHDQDIRGWPLMDDAGREVGRIDEMIVDTDTRHVETVVLENGAEFPVSALDIGKNEVRLDREYAARFAGAGGLMSHGARTGQSAPGPREGQIRIPIIEEHVEVGKQRVESSGAQVHTRLTERPVEKEVTLRDEKVTVERRPADRMATDKDVEMAKRGEHIQVNTVHEEPVIRKQSKVVEEVVIGKEATERKETVREKERKTEVDVDTPHDLRKR
jgi:stress response protein YsnF